MSPRRNILGTAIALLTMALAFAVMPQLAAQAAGPNVQVITVRASSNTTTYATLEAWTRTSSGAYRRVAGPWSARLGRRGLAAPGTKTEGDGQTPSGQFRVSPAFGVASDPGTALPYFTVDTHDWWVSDSSSPYYNRHYRCARGTCPFRESLSEQLITYPVQYRYAAFINYNTNPAVPGKGSAIFLHVNGTGYTAGCISVSESHMTWLLRWMKPATSTTPNPLISIGVGANAYAPIPVRITG